MQDFIKQSGFIVLALLVIIIIRQAKAEVQIPVKLVISVVLFGTFVGVLEGVIGGMNEVFSYGSVSKYATVMLKVMFVSIITTICASLCNDAGEGTLGYICTLIGKAQIMLLSLPLIFEIMDMAVKLIDGV